MIISAISSGICWVDLTLLICQSVPLRQTDRHMQCRGICANREWGKGEMRRQEGGGSWLLVTKWVRARGSLRSQLLFFFLSLTKEAGSSAYVLEVFHCELRTKWMCSFESHPWEGDGIRYLNLRLGCMEVVVLIETLLPFSRFSKNVYFHQGFVYSLVFPAVVAWEGWGWGMGMLCVVSKLWYRWAGNGLPCFPSAKVNTGPGIQMEELPVRA